MHEVHGAYTAMGTRKCKVGGEGMGGRGVCWVKFGLETNKVCSSSEADFIEVL
jgi:hypothetical protein